ncbi:hypothetical protein EON76_04890 [bacterium]|nr:MAG: hypothetical protein EON76_04890 [bacterium]
MHRHLRSRRNKIIITVCAVLIGALLLIAYLPAFAAYFPDGRLTFTPQQPTALPNGIRLTSASLTATKLQTAPSTYNKVISYALDTKAITISQERNPFTKPLSCAQKTLNTKCEMIKTERGREFRIETRQVDNTKTPTAESTQFIQYIDGTTYTFIHVEKGAMNRYGTQDWSKVIDGLQSIQLENVPIIVQEASRG